MNRFGGIDPLEPLAALGMADVVEVQPVSGGMDTLIWRVHTPDGAYALRLFRADQRDQCSKEVRVMQAVGSLGVPVPRITTHGMWGDRPAMLMEWCAGRPLFEEALAHPELSESLGVSMGRLQARLHARSLPQTDWEDHQTWLSLAGPAEAELQARLRASGLRDGYPLHLDFHPRNVLCAGHEATVVLDWANMTVGDPRADVARTRSIFRFVSSRVAPSAPGLDSIRETLERAWIEGYTQHAGPLPDMTLFEIWAAVVFIRDMEQYLGRPDFWMELSDFDRIRAQIAALKQRAGLS